MTTNTKSKNWVIAWRPFDPAGMFVQAVGDTGGKNPSLAITPKHGVSNALRMTKSEAVFLLRSLEEQHYHERLILVDLADHLFGVKV